MGGEVGWEDGNQEHPRDSAQERARLRAPLSMRSPLDEDMRFCQPNNNSCEELADTIVLFMGAAIGLIVLINIGMLIGRGVMVVVNYIWGPLSFHGKLILTALPCSEFWGSRQ
ncbi:hypothetical protein NDU88_006725 [Pleurodeles waltl]|uniref:Uncharacterized protein n=1 Tax=Pleurodeles waltl TaxID=8319 RepID=A0AAV7SQM6_PLEWA|nr:hypothetical protein NDU88_006725 [Pleurodeles waltl]